MKRFSSFLLLPLMASTPAYAADGQASYQKHCSLCHQADGMGIPGTFPRLMGRVGEIAATTEGATFIARLLLWGMSGTITVDDTPVTGTMPGVAHLADEELVSIITFLATEGGEVQTEIAFNLETLQAARAAGRLQPTEVNGLRQQLFDNGTIK